MHTISIDNQKTIGKQKLMIDISGAPYIEQILFNKMMLYTSLYHHHKVRSIECMFHAIFEACKDFDLKMNGFDFKNVIDFLSVTDVEMLTLNGKPKEIIPMIQNIQNRNLLKRAFIISKKTIDAVKTSPSSSPEPYDKRFYDLLTRCQNPLLIRELRERITQKIKGEITVYDIWIDIPRPPSFSEVNDTLIHQMDDERVLLDEIFKVEMWIDGYLENKWRGHVYCPPQYREQVKKIVPTILKDEFGINFNKYATMTN